MIVQAQPYWRLRGFGESRKLGSGQEFIAGEALWSATGAITLPVEPLSRVCAIFLRHIPVVPAQ
jgi:hypothetical protein